MDKSFSTDSVSLAEACKVLAQNREIQVYLKDELGSTEYAMAMGMMKAGKLDGTLGALVHDLVYDRIHEASDVIWSGHIRQEHDDYPVSVFASHGLYWVWAMEYDPVGYFLDANAAIEYARSAWDEVYEDGDEPEDRTDEER